MMEELYPLPLIGDYAPAFTAKSTQGEITFPGDYKGKWVVLFSHPADFTPVCTTEFIGFQKSYADFKAINTELLGYSVDGVHSHIEWLRNIEKNF
ncbi:MAG: redoxin domain-containing protein [Candidatus Peribacteria bacterium]|nr:redoxin domain-containing protein [Candidatus Peribacteria bacterium]